MRTGGGCGIRTREGVNPTRLPASIPATQGFVFGVGWSLIELPAPDGCWFLRAGGRVKGRAAPAGGAVGALDAVAREWIMGTPGPEA
jgi:hypothetical protein